MKGRVESVRLSSRLTESAAVLVDEEDALGVHMERMLRQTQRDLPRRRRHLELNPRHALFEQLARRHAADPRSRRVPEFAELFHAQALLAEGSPLPDPQGFGRLITELVANACAAESSPPEEPPQTGRP